jgi:hypothetical protein
VAVSTFDPAIEVWDLDVIDSLQPVAVLGGYSEGDASTGPQKRSKKKKRRKEDLKEGSHTDSVLSLAWNQSHRNILASGSADHHIKVCLLQLPGCSPLKTRSLMVSNARLCVLLARRATTHFCCDCDFHRVSLTVALLILYHSGLSFVGENTQDCSAISRYFSHKIPTQVVQYLARLWYCSLRSPSSLKLLRQSCKMLFVHSALCFKGSSVCRDCEPSCVEFEG